jgi:hypothetical protein
VQCECCKSEVPDVFIRTEKYVHEAIGKQERKICCLCLHYLPYVQYASDVVYGDGFQTCRRAKERAIQQVWLSLSGADADFVAGLPRRVHASR